MSNISYPGKELEIFSVAVNWKSYWASRIKDHLGRVILEVGAGIGSNTQLLWKEDIKRWVCLEPDKQLLEQLSYLIGKNDRTSNCELVNGTLIDLPQNSLFDTILYIDVLEHIEDDKAEINLAVRHLTSRGKLIILSPAHDCLFSKFDEAIGHYRRYDKNMLKELIPNGYKFITLEYLDSVGLFMSLGNSILLRSPNPSEKQIKIWDSFVIPLSRQLDKIAHFHFGKTLLAVLCRGKSTSI
jgi:2-polyprenyl-3-methyl-5-hydroxy-6-metoxy-1,4-benzoquinol methylase